MKLFLKITMRLLLSLIAILLFFGPFVFLYVLFELFSFKILVAVAIVVLLCLIWSLDINKYGEFCDKIFDKIEQMIRKIEKSEIEEIIDFLSVNMLFYFDDKYLRLVLKETTNTFWELYDRELKEGHRHYYFKWLFVNKKWVNSSFLGNLLCEINNQVRYNNDVKECLSLLGIAYKVVAFVKIKNVKVKEDNIERHIIGIQRLFFEKMKYKEREGSYHRHKNFLLDGNAERKFFDF